MGKISQIARGDRVALEQFYIENKTYVFRIELSILHDIYLAEDATQETFLKVQKNANQYHIGISERAWLITIARNTAIDILRKRKHETMQEVTNLNIAVDGNMGSEMEFMAILQPLAEVDKEIVCLRILSDLQHKEIAKVLNMPISTVKKRYERALKKLKVLLREESHCGK